MEHFIGIDNSSLDHKVRVVDEKGNLDLSFTIANDYEGFEMLDRKLRKIKDSQIGFELPHGPLVDFLHEHDYKLYSLNPLKIKRFKESLKVSGNKNDDIDAVAIADYLRSNKNYSRELLYNSHVIEKLKNLSIIHTRLTQNRARHLNKLHFVVRQYFPLQEALFGDFGCIVQLKMLIKYSTFTDLNNTSDKEIDDFLKVNRYRRQDYIDRIIQKIRKYNQLISEDVEFAYRIEAQCLCDLLHVINNRIKEIETEMNKTTDAHNLGKVFKSLPGAGKVLACKLLALFGDNKDRFNNYNGVQCLFGTAPKNYQSGMYHKVIMRKACNKSARAILYKFSFSTLQFSKWSREYYDKQKAKGKTHSVAVRALSNKWIKVIFKIWKDEIFYEEDKKLAPVAWHSGCSG
ncbi:MAG: IS110 family transposase [Spirochaetes bacterium]|nr:IS110 family transposase [Spirochaetota bacterium]